MPERRIEGDTTLKKLFTAALLVTAATLFAASPDFVIPAAGTGPGAGGSQWQSELTLHNAGREAADVTLVFHQAAAAPKSFTLTLQPRTTVSIADVVKSRFGVDAGTGAIVVDTSDVASRKIAITSRTFNRTVSGDLGQDIRALRVSEALGAGDTGVVPGPSDAVASRFNFGLFALDATVIEWRLLRADGEEAAETSVSYAAGTHMQYNGGVSTLLAATPEGNDTVHARIISGAAFLYGSTVDETSGDPTFVPAGRTRENLQVLFLGVDLNEDGNIDVADANGDLVLDQPIDVIAGIYPNFFRVVVADPEGADVTLTVVSHTSETRLVDAEGTLQWYPPASRRGTSGALKVKAFDGVDEVEITIPVNFR
jgi:hypothetical protein